MKNWKFILIVSVIVFVLLEFKVFWYFLLIPIGIFLTGVAHIAFIILYLKKTFLNVSSIFDLRSLKSPWFIPRWLFDAMLKALIEKLEETSSSSTVIESFSVEKAMEILEVTELDVKVIKTAWKEKQKIFHPDSQISPDEKKSKEINEAYDILLKAI